MSERQGTAHSWTVVLLGLHRWSVQQPNCADSMLLVQSRLATAASWFTAFSGFFAASIGQTACVACGVGLFQLTGGSQCSPCTAGTASNVTGASSCPQCLKGSAAMLLVTLTLVCTGAIQHQQAQLAVRSVQTARLKRLPAFRSASIAAPESSATKRCKQTATAAAQGDLWLPQAQLHALRAIEASSKPPEAQCAQPAL